MSLNGANWVAVMVQERRHFWIVRYVQNFVTCMTPALRSTFLIPSQYPIASTRQHQTQGADIGIKTIVCSVPFFSSRFPNSSNLTLGLV
ncbi:hypothetical protein RRG08_038819 [Elysia crispata]|uniref:Uncharacterized protein n=1 Tax=Elysia crispata TaxID=231223 RepID=A0AAE0YU78_9GAST|nr:hypothetical protein RRG08_038819 [Elysia crispata]